MTVKNLIEKLKQCEDDDKDIFVSFGEYFDGMDIIDIEDDNLSVFLILNEEDVFDAVDCERWAKNDTL